MAEPVSILCLEGESKASAQLERELALLATEAQQSLHATGVAIALEVGERIICRARAGASAPEVGTVLDRNAGISGRCIREARPLRVYDSSLDPRVDGEVCLQVHIRSLAMVPIVFNQRVVGIIEAFSDSTGAFEQENLQDLAVFAEYASSLMFAPTEQTPSRAELPPSTSGQHSIALLPPPGISRPTLVPVSSENSPAQKEASPTLQSLSGFSVPLNTSKRTLLLTACASFAVLLVGFFLLAARRHVQPLSVHLPNAPAAASSAAATHAASSSTPALPTPTNEPDENVERSSIEQNQSKTKQLLERAGSGDVQAQIALADNYAAGNEENDAVAAGSWYIVAGIDGNQRAKQRATELTRKLNQFQIGQIRFNVAKMFEQGVGVPTDLVSSYCWLVLAEDAGDVRAVAEQEKIAEILTPSEIAQAHTRAEAWLLAHKVRLAR
jgi:putative methionine-R-sulfoxide reductase with GAF domain